MLVCMMGITISCIHGDLSFANLFSSSCSDFMSSDILIIIAAVISHRSI